MPFFKTRNTLLMLIVTCTLASILSCVTDTYDPTPGIYHDGSTCHYRVAVGLNISTLAPTETAHAVSVVSSLDGTPVSGSVSWASDNSAVASVASDGVVTAIDVGTVGIKATIAGCTGSATLNVSRLPPIANVAVSIDSTTLPVGHTSQARAVARDSAGNALSAPTVSWVSLTPSVGTVSESGMVTAVSSGTATIQAAILGDSGQVSFVVTDTSSSAPPPPPPPPPPPAVVVSVTVAIDSATLVVGHTAQAFATARDAAGVAITGRTISWTAVNPGLATISSAGVITGVSAGTAGFQANVDGIVGGSSLTVRAVPPPAVATVTVAIDSATLLVGHVAHAAATARDATGAVLTGLTVTWTSANTSLATVSSTGAVTGVAAGTAAIRASVGGITGSSSVTIVAPPPSCATIAVSIDSTTLLVGHLAQAVAVPKDGQGNPVNGLTIMWTSLAPTIASVNSLGRITALAAGVVVIQATSGACSGTKSLTVTAPPGGVSVVSVATDSTSLAVGHQSQASAVAKDASGTIVTGQSVTWTSLTPSTLTVSSTGVVQAIASGTGQIQAQVSGIAGVKSLDVVAPPDLAASNFNDGTYGVFQKEDPDGAVSIVDDPTGAGRGKVVRIHYAGVNQDRNRSVYFDYPTGIGLGKTIYSRFRVYHASPFNTNTFIGRKYIYWQEGSPSLGLPFGQPFWSVIGLNGSEFAIDLGHFNQGGSVTQVNANNIFSGGIKADKWYTIETQMTVNSTPSSTDGIFRVWIDGALIYEKTNFRWTDPTWPVNFANFGFHWFFVGDQTSYTSGSFDEIRLIDDVAFSTKRIGQ
jgi:uncharacterized protein YjdB